MVANNLPPENAPDGCGDDGTEKRHESGEEGEERDRDGDESRIGSQWAEEDAEERRKGRGEEADEEGFGSDADRGQVKDDHIREID